MNRIITFFATWFYIGYIKIAPGTFGTIGAVPLLFLMKKLSFGNYVIVLVLLIFFAINISTMSEKIFNKKDASNIVIDEVVGYLVAALFINFNLINVICSIVVFRFFDIIKPYPINKLQKLSGGIGVVADDIVAGIFSAIVLYYLGYLTCC
jgi:phosphatidylglycerophosphatase A